jgi:hypothetical protein
MSEMLCTKPRSTSHTPPLLNNRLPHLSVMLVF